MANTPKETDEKTASDFDPDTGEVREDLEDLDDAPPTASKVEHGLVKTIEAQALQLADNDATIKKLEGDLAASKEGEAARIEDIGTAVEQIDLAGEEMKLLQAAVVVARREQQSSSDLYESQALRLSAVTKDRDALRTDLEETKADLVMALRRTGGATSIRTANLSRLLHSASIQREHDAGGEAETPIVYRPPAPRKSQLSPPSPHLEAMRRRPSPLSPPINQEEDT